jgi:LysM repeat protein
MTFVPNRRFKILAAAVIAIAAFTLCFAAIRHFRTNRENALSDRILITPGANSDEESEADTTPTAVATSVPDQKTLAANAASTPTPEPAPIEMIDGTPQTIATDHLLSSSVAVTPYKLDGSDNYWTVADDNGINLYTLIGANPTLPFKAHLGLNVILLSRKGVLHMVYPGEKLAEIAAAYHVDEKIIRRENHIHWWRGIKTGDVLFIPDAHPIRMSREWSDYFDRRGFFGVPFTKGGEAITSGFGWRMDPINGKREFHTGLDFRASFGKTVFAAATGKVVFAGVGGGYGNLIIIHHNKEYNTYYGHLSEILVKVGEKVRRGQLIGKVGSTGHATGPHLHFEIRRNGKAINPLPLI